MLRYLTAGESHGKAMTAVLEGLPAGLSIDEAFINRELQRRKAGYGRGTRMKIEPEKVVVLSGVRHGVTLGSPVCLMVENKDASIETLHSVLCPRPGHADLAGVMKYGFNDVRDVLERASARNTVSTVLIGALCKMLLRLFSIEASSKVVSVAGHTKEKLMQLKIDEAITAKDTVGGIFEVCVRGVPAGLGSYVQPDRRLDARLACEIMAIPGVKGVEIGLGFGYAQKSGSEVHDAIFYSKQKGFYRATNNAGGIEGGMSNGQDIILRGCMKPICTLMKPLPSVNIATKKASKAATERSDTCVVASAGVIAESACAYVVANAFLEKFSGDHIDDIKRACKAGVRRSR